MVNHATGKLLTLSINKQTKASQESIQVKQAIQEMSLEFRDLDYVGCQNQVWFFRYDCIVNQACPNIVLEPSDDFITIS